MEKYLINLTGIEGTFLVQFGKCHNYQHTFIDFDF